MIQNKSLYDVYKDIRAKIEELLSTSEDLNDIQDVIYGERQRVGSIKTPAIWIVPSSYTPQVSGGQRAIHDIPFDFVTFVKHQQPQEGLKLAQDYAMKIYDVMLADRTLDGLVSDVRPTRVDPAYEIGNSTQVYWSATQFVFRLQRRE